MIVVQLIYVSMYVFAQKICLIMCDLVFLKFLNKSRMGDLHTLYRNNLRDFLQ